MMPRDLEKLGEMIGIQQIRMSVEWRRDLFFQHLDLSGLEGWPDQNKVATHALLAEYHDIFSLEPGEMGFTNLAKHEFRVFNDKPFKMQFQRIPPTMVD